MDKSGSFNKTEKNASLEAFSIANSYACQLSLMEFGLGSLLHAFHVPFSGFFLSLNQCFVLNRACILHPASTPWPRFLPVTISNTAAIIKSLSPYGKKITPMLAISVQGLLFNMGTILFGRTLSGRCAGSLLLGVWPMLQPLLIYGIIYGLSIASMGNFYHQMADKIPPEYSRLAQVIIAGYIFFHLFFSLCVCLLTTYLPAKLLDRYDRYIVSCSSSQLKPMDALKQSSLLQKLHGVWKDFTAPLFLLSLLFSAFFFYATLHSFGSFFFAFFRIIATAFLTFFLIRNISVEWCMRMLSKSTLFKKYIPYVEEVLQRIRSRSNSR